MDRKAVSVIIPCYNDERYIGQSWIVAANTVLTHSIEPYEIWGDQLN